MARYAALRDDYMALATSVQHAVLARPARQRRATTAPPRERAASPPPRQALAVYAGQRFRGFADFQPALQAARDRARRVHGETWYLVPGASIKARVPRPWMTCTIGNRVCASVRDANMPAAEFWPDGMLPVGPVYAQPLGPRRLASIKVRSIITGAEAEMHPYEAVAFFAVQEERARKMRMRIEHEERDVADEDRADDRLAAD